MRSLRFILTAYGVPYKSTRKGDESVKKIIIRKTEAVKLTTKGHPVHMPGNA